jgi:DNA-binding NarL/FixJ family response regulator
MLDLAEAVHQADMTIPLLLVGGDLADALLVRAIQLGAAVVPRGGPVAEDALLAFLQRAVRLRATGPDRLVRALRHLYSLTVQEARIVRLALSGETRAVIAEMLDISPKTYDRHADNIRDKTGRSLRSLRDTPADALLAELESKATKAFSEESGFE